MEKINIPQVESRSADLVKDNIEQLKAIFPEVIKEGKVDFEALHDLLGEYGDTAEERFCLNWAGKAEARREAQKRSTGTLRPCPEDSVDWDSTENLYIEGDNLEVLKLLQKGYHKKVKMIYIDPPYNTGKDFVYKDNYKDNLINYLEQTGQNRAISTKALSDSDGRYHSNWLNMMYPRLKLARNLLTEDGVIFISIGEEEVYNLRAIANEIFGEDNLIMECSRVMKSGGAKGKFYTPSIDYILVYAKYIAVTDQFRGSITDEQINRFYNKKETDGERKGELYGEERLYKASLDARANQRYFIKCPDGSFVIPPGISFPAENLEGVKITPTSQDGVWKWIYSRYKDELDKGNIIFKETSTSALVDENGKKSKWNIYNKLWLSEQQEKGVVPSNFLSNFENRQSSSELKKIDIPFDFAKPVSLLSYLLEVSNTKNSDVILDFFSGSASIAHAVMQLNGEDGGCRKYICVQIPEETPKGSEAHSFLVDLGKPTTIPEIAKERIRRAGKKIVEEQKAKNDSLFAEESPKLDIGFKVFKLDSSNINSWDSSPENIEQALSNSLFNIKEDRTESDLLYEILIKYGIELSTKVNTHTIAGKTVYEMGAGSLIVCLADNLTTEVAEGIAKLWKEVKPEGANIPCRVVFKDSGFDGSDEVKSNTLLILKQHGITNVASV